MFVFLVSSSKNKFNDVDNDNEEKGNENAFKNYLDQIFEAQNKQRSSLDKPYIKTAVQEKPQPINFQKLTDSQKKSLNIWIHILDETLKNTTSNKLSFRRLENYQYSNVF